jgi:hypothetical protein
LQKAAPWSKISKPQFKPPRLNVAADIVHCGLLKIHAMRKHEYARAVGVAAALLLAGCVAAEPTPELVDPTGFVTYAHSTGVFTLDMPPDWVVSDTSDDTAINVEFSPPNSPEPLIGVYVISADLPVQGTPAAPVEATEASPGPESPDLDTLIGFYQAAFYAGTDITYKETARDPQPDGSLRIKFLIDSPQGTSQHNDFLHVRGPYFVALRIRIPEDHAQLRTLGRVINTLTINEGAEWASAAPDQGGSRDVVGFASLNAWADRNGGFQIVGQVANNAPLALEFVRITAQLYDDENNLLAEQDDFVSSDLVLPGEFTPFSIVFSDGLPPGTARYDLNASARYADYAARTFYGAENFAITSQADFDENGLLVVSGQVRNEGNLAASLTKVIVTIFDADQRVIATDTTLVDVQRLAPGESSTYSVTFVELGGTPNTFLVTAQAIIEE